MKRRVSRYNDRVGPDLSSGMMVLTIFLAAVVILCVFFAFNSEPLIVPPSDTGTSDATEDFADETEPPPLIPEDMTDVVSVKSEDMSRGYLILVNSSHEYVFGHEDIVLLFHNEDKSDSINLATSDIACERSVLPYLNTFIDAYFSATADDKVLINSGYRSYEAQEQILNDRIESDGEEEAYKFVSLPGQSEHHTGLGLDIASYGENYNSKWLIDNSWQFGFVQRYRADKVSITGISSEYWHYRYVGAPHAEIMVTENLCLEEYIELLHGYTYEVPYEFAASDGRSYLIYHVMCGEGEETSVRVPRGVGYTVSGDNVDGFIITAERPEGVS